jgi:predicted nucleic acid-binding protein
VLDSGAMTRIAEGSGTARAILRALVARGFSVTMPAVVLVECLTGDGRRDATTHRVLHAVGDVRPTTEHAARAAAALRHRTGNPSVIDALVAELALGIPGAVAVLTTDVEDLEALVDGAAEVRVVGC